MERSFPRSEDREQDQKRSVMIQTGYLETNPASVLITMGKTKVICAATTDNWMPPHVRDTGQGWIGAQYSMLPNSSPNRIQRERTNVKGRTREIERLIGRSLRAVCDLGKIPAQSIIVDCDVIQADGGTRTASVTGGFIALYLLIKNLQAIGRVKKSPFKDFLAAISVGIVRGEILLDLDSSEDMEAQVDMNIVMTESGTLAEVQATGEEATFSKDKLDAMIEYGSKGVKELIIEQKKAMGII